MDPFEFDCPQTVCNLTEEPSVGDLNWFQVLHPLHETSQHTQVDTHLSTRADPEGTLVPLVQFPKAEKGQFKAKEFPTLKNTSRASSRPNSRDQAQNPPIPELNEKDMLLMLRRHNEKFVPSSQYEPPRHSVRDVRKWEKVTGRVWSTLTPDERTKANYDISQMKSNIKD